LDCLGLEVELGTEVTSIEDAPDGLRVTLDTGGRTETVSAAYVLGAGGGHSITRHSMQEHLTGETYDGRYFVADAKVRLPCPPECGRLVIGPAGFVLLSPLPDDRWLIFVNRDEADTRRELPTEAELGALLNARIGTDVGLNDLRWVSPFNMHKRVVERPGLRKRPVGDRGFESVFLQRGVRCELIFGSCATLGRGVPVTIAVARGDRPCPPQTRCRR